MSRNAFQSFDGARLSYRAEGEGRPVVMLHGFLANSRFNWIEPGISEAVTDAGFQAIMLDLRGHGRSEASEDAAAYPPDVLARDGEALLAHLNLADYDLVGYSLGARTAVRMLVRGARPRRCVLGGMGDSGILGSAARVSYFEDAIQNGERSKTPQAAKIIHAMMQRAKLNPQAMLNVLKAQVQTTQTELDGVETPILVVSGRDDDDNGNAEGLARHLKDARAERVPGNHLSAVQAPELAQAIVGFLRA
ncbi:MAG: alpha/beta fold hydrolase [Proteobacteria bacterium]|nr:alpha/beta fold hydrolase [Pseudomonadota bacterium]